MQKENKELFPVPLAGKVACKAVRGAHKGFTLIELLVVVLIIGILAAVAVPQYRIAVYKSQLQALVPIMKNIKEAEKTYYLANGNYTLSFEQLDIDLPAAKQCSEPAATYGNYYPSAQCRDFGNSFCALSSVNAVICGLKHPSVRLQLDFYLKYNGNWVCWANTNDSLAMQICKVISGKKGINNGAHVFDF